MLRGDLGARLSVLLECLSSFTLIQIPKFGIVVVLALGALGFRDRKETDVLQLIWSVSLIAKQSGFSRTRTTTSRRDLSWSVNIFLKFIHSFIHSSEGVSDGSLGVF